MDNKVSDKKYLHCEAFALMNYECEACGCKEIIWNSRDGVTPFIVGCQKCDGMMKHIDWNKDVRNPNYLPDKGQRVFIDITPQIAEVLIRAKVKHFWNNEEYPMSEHWDTPEEAVKELLAEEAVKELLAEGVKEGEPHIITVS